MEPKDWITLVSILATVVISITTILINVRNEYRRQQHDDDIRKEQVLREDNIRETYSKKTNEYFPRIEFRVEARFFGPEHGNWIAEFLLIVKNKGKVPHKFNDIRIRVRGIFQNTGLEYWIGNEPRLNFPEKLVDNASLLPSDYNFFFVEPDVEQVFTYISKIPDQCKYLLVHTEFAYDQFTPHTSERVFEIPSSASTSK